MITYEVCPPQGVRFHPLAELFPWIEGDAHERLKEDIRLHGVREPIVFLGDAIIDGRNRYMCARDLNIEYPRREFGSDPKDGADPVAFVLSVNLYRRHMTDSQRASVAGKLANMSREDTLKSYRRANLPDTENIEENPVSPQEPGISAATAATMLNVSERSVKSARKVHERGAPELAAAVDRGDVSVSAAAAVADLPADEQRAIVAEGSKAVQKAAKAARAPKEPDAESHDEDPETEKARRALMKLTPAALVDDVLVLRAAVAKLKGKLAAVTAECDNMKADLAMALDSDQGRSLGNALRDVREATGRMKEHQKNAVRLDRQLKAVTKDRDKLRAELESQMVPLN